MVEASAAGGEEPAKEEDRQKALQLRVHELERLLAAERQLSSKARKKVRQLLEKLQQRDGVIAGLRSQLKVQPPTASALARHNGRKSHRARVSSELIAQLEEHLAQMLENLAGSEHEVRELEELCYAKRAERRSNTSRTEWQALDLLEQQLNEKRVFTTELLLKTQELEQQVSQAKCGPAAHQRKDAAVPTLHLDGQADAQAEQEDTAASPPDHSDEALSAFLAAAGPAGDAIVARPALRACFADRPPRLCEGCLDGCAPEQRAEVFGLFAAWVAVVGEEPGALCVTDLGLLPTDARDVADTFATCAAQIQECEMTRCSGGAAAFDAFYGALAGQPLRRLCLGYNVLGPPGASALMAAAASWAGSLEHLSVEMNGIGDNACREMCAALAAGALPHLRVLELGWNELSSACGSALASLLAEPRSDEPTAPPRTLQRIGLSGNTLGSEGAEVLIMAAVSEPARILDLDLSMNYVGASALGKLAEWAKECTCDRLAVSIGLEWNDMEEADALRQLVSAVAGSRSLEAAGSGAAAGAQQPLVRLANNEFVGLDSGKVLAASFGLISC